MGLYVDAKDLSKDNSLYPTALEAREKLICGLGEFHDAIAVSR